MRWKDFAAPIYLEILFDIHMLSNTLQTFLCQTNWRLPRKSVKMTMPILPVLIIQTLFKQCR